MSDVKEVVSATGCFQKLTSEFGKIEEVKSNLFDQLEPDEEFIVQDYRLIKQKKSDEPEVKFQNTLLKQNRKEEECTDHMNWNEVAKLPLDVDHKDFIEVLDGCPIEEQ